MSVQETLEKQLIYGNIKEIELSDYSKYQTCRGQADKGQFITIIKTIFDESADEDERDDAVNDGLWDLFMHQYTMYSATPLALYLILTHASKEQIASCQEVTSFIDLCESRGNDGIYLTNQELEKNLAGELPIFSIPEIISKYR